jgi:hypothetical protein
LRNCVAAIGRASSLFAVLARAKSSRSLPAVNTPEPPEITMLRISGSDCADLIASAIDVYMFCVSAFFLSGRRIVMMRVLSSSVTITWSVMVVSLEV